MATVYLLPALVRGQEQPTTRPMATYYPPLFVAKGCGFRATAYCLIDGWIRNRRYGVTQTKTSAQPQMPAGIASQQQGIAKCLMLMLT